MNLTLVAYLNLLVAAWWGWIVYDALRRRAVSFALQEFSRSSDPAGYWFVTMLYTAFMVMCALISLDTLTSWIFP